MLQWEYKLMLPIMFKFFRRKKTEEISRTTPGFEETERRTPKTGIILLIIMFIAGLFFGWRALDDVSRIPNAPPSLSSCSYRYRDSVYLAKSPVRPYEAPYLYYEYDDSSRCTFSELEKAHNIPQLFEPRKPFEAELRSVFEQLNTVNQSLNEARARLRQATGEYEVGLEERQAKVPQPLFPPEQARESIPELRAQVAVLEKQKDELESRQRTLEAELKTIDERSKQAYQPVFKEQNKLLRWYEFKVFLFQFAFIIPFFFLAFRAYLRLHRKNSPYTIIATGILAVAAILLLRVILFWFWGLFLARVLEVLLRWFNNFQILRSIVFYLGMILSFVVFGGAVYWLQKKIFDPQRVMLRRFRAKQCPHCQASLDLAASFCPNCGAQIKEQCTHCSQYRFIGLPVCPHCGAKK